MSSSWICELCRFRFLVWSQKLGKFTTYRVLPFNKNIWNIVPFWQFQKTSHMAVYYRWEWRCTFFFCDIFYCLSIETVRSICALLCLNPCKLWISMFVCERIKTTTVLPNPFAYFTRWHFFTYLNICVLEFWPEPNISGLENGQTTDNRNEMHAMVLR